MFFSFRDLIDILIVAYVIYRIILSIHGTKAITLVKGLAVVFASLVVARSLNLHTVSWLLDQTTTLILVALPVVFYPELRRALEQLGRGRLFYLKKRRNQASEFPELDLLVDAVLRLSSKKIGALIALERDFSLAEISKTGVQLDAKISTELLLNIFEPNTALHDGAVIIANSRIISAASVLPLTEQKLQGNLGTRHRAAVGLSEQYDAVVLVVSEQTGIISLAIEGSLRRYLTETRLKEQLQYYLSRGGSRK